MNSYVRLDPRIKVIFRKENGHISLNSNSALELATGEWLALMDHDDLLPPNALYEIVKLINNEDNVQLIYSDEDKIDEYGMRFMPHFKSDFNLDLLYSQNYISHLGVYKTEIANKIGGFRKGFEGSQDYDFLLRYIQNININNIKHIPKILYHWRAIKGSTALSATQKSYTTASGIKALQDYFLSEKKDVVVEKGQLENTYRVRWPLVDEPLVSLIIPTYNGYQITKQAIDSILNKQHIKILKLYLLIIIQMT
ncbi:glycosyltransferase family 2 protein [Spirabiliibacterium mucosae]|uniref:glycosyltransferase family 2 protein n=1 Tax=Spirabiliibacterium mucosae TaxID=28156 RepID=UPI001AACC0C8|nr:glycosyltransferase [Spirabiliibacterium mucosae]